VDDNGGAGVGQRVAQERKLAGLDTCQLCAVSFEPISDWGRLVQPRVLKGVPCR
jgi:hypothetical protein